VQIISENLEKEKKFQIAKSDPCACAPYTWSRGAPPCPSAAPAPSCPGSSRGISWRSSRPAAASSVPATTQQQQRAVYEVVLFEMMFLCIVPKGL